MNKKIELIIDGMSCVTCANTVEKALRKIKGVSEAHVYFATEKAVIEADEHVLLEELIIAVHRAGYRAHLANDDSKTLIKESGFWNFAFAALFSAPLCLQMFWNFLGLQWEIPGVIQGILATIVQIGFGWRFYEGAYHSLKSRSANMDLLIALGTTAAYIYSLVIFIFEWPLHLYFESSALIITFVLMGRWLEAKTKGKASEALHKLLKLQPKYAQVEIDGVLINKSIDTIEIGDLFVVRPGEKVCVDGEVIEGESYVDESLLTGESKQVFKKTGAKIFGATLNQNGILKAKALKVGSDTLFHEIIKLVEDAQNSRAPIQSLADRVSYYFVPIVVLISILTCALWTAFGNVNAGIINAVSVLVIACPCALGLATPTVIMVASGIASNKGILFRDAAAIESAAKIDTLMIDKTGTLTAGKPIVSGVYPTDFEDEFHLLKIAQTLENQSQHPIAQAISTYAESKGLHPFESRLFESIPGKGLNCEIEGKQYFVGSEAYAKEILNHEISYSGNHRGQTHCLVWTQDRILGEIVIADPLRKSAPAFVKSLKKLNILPIVVTGDHKATAEKIAKEAGIDHFEAELLPENKVQIVKDKMLQGRHVGMVGDGINDAPALASAHVGFAMSTGSDIAMESSDVTLIGDDLTHISKAIDLSKQSLTRIKQNLFFAFFYNSLGIPLAACGFLNPVIAAAAMALSSVCVVTNALLLKK